MRVRWVRLPPLSPFSSDYRDNLIVRGKAPRSSASNRYQFKAKWTRRNRCGSARYRICCRSPTSRTKATGATKPSATVVISTIIFMNLVFSFDSILSALAITDVFLVLAAAIIVPSVAMFKGPFYFSIAVLVAVDIVPSGYQKKLAIQRGATS